MGITSVEPDRTSAFVLEVPDAPQVVALARGSTDVQILTVDPDADAATWFGRLPTTPVHVVADARAVRALLADDPGRSWLGQVSDLSLALPVGEPPTVLLQAATDLESLGLCAEHVEHVTTTIAVFLRRSAGEAVVARPLSEQFAEAFARAAAEANEAADSADRARRDEALALAQLRANIERNASRMSRSGAGRKRPRSRWRRAMRHPLIAARRILGKIKRGLT